MRVFVFGSCLGIVSSLILGTKYTSENASLVKTYFTATYGMLGTVIIICFLPVLCAADLYNTSNDKLILPIAVMNMVLALLAGAIGSFAASSWLNIKFSAH